MIKKLPRFLFYGFYFGFCLLNVSSIYYLAKHLCIHYDFNPTSNLITTQAASSFILPETIFLNHYNTLT